MAIKANDLIGKFQEALSDAWGYIWGTAGVKWTAARQEALEKTTDADRAQGRKYGSKWIGHMVADCSGLFTWAFKQLGGTMYHGSNTMWNKWCTEKGELTGGKRTDGKELLPGTAVFTFKQAKKNRSHVGLYIGDGWVIEAANTQKGVVKSKITNEKWNEWGELKGVEYQKSDNQEQNTHTVLPTIRRGNKNAFVKKCQEMLDKLGYSLGICGVDSDFGTATEKAVREFQRDHKLTQDGVVGPETWDALQKAVDQLKEPEKEILYTVEIKHLKKATADEIVKKYGGTVTKE